MFHFAKGGFVALTREVGVRGEGAAAALSSPLKSGDFFRHLSPGLNPSFLGQPPWAPPPCGPAIPQQWQSSVLSSVGEGRRRKEAADVFLNWGFPTARGVPQLNMGVAKNGFKISSVVHLRCFWRTGIPSLHLRGLRVANRKGVGLVTAVI